MRVANNTEWLFFHLWKKNPNTQLSCLNINIAETVIYRWAQPYFWYQTAKDGVIIRKNKEKISLQAIEDSFLNNLPKCEVIAKTLTSYEDPALQTQEKIEFDYIIKPDFHDFLFQREKSQNIIIQKFIEPKSGQNALIKVAWTPQFCLFLRKTNINDINNQKISLLNRLVTFEGLEHLSNSDSISTPILASELEQTCISIVKHINSVTSGNIQISKMVLYFKLDDKNRLWLLFCTGLKLREKIPSSAGSASFKKKVERPLSPVMMVSTKKDKEVAKPKIPLQYLLEDQINQIDDNACIRCNKEDLLYDVKLKHVLEYEEKVMKALRAQELEQADDLDLQDGDIYLGKTDRIKMNIPAIMKKLYPTLTEERYIKLKKNASLMTMPIKVCENCYLTVTENMHENTDESNSKKMQNPMREAMKKDSDYYGASSLSISRRQMASDKAIRIITQQNREMEKDSYNLSAYTNSDMTSKRYSRDQQNLDELQFDKKNNKMSAFSSFKKNNLSSTKSNLDGYTDRLPEIGAPYITEFKGTEPELVLNNYVRTPNGQPSQIQTNIKARRQFRSPYATEMKPWNKEVKTNKSTDPKKFTFPVRPQSREKHSTEVSPKNSIAQLWKPNNKKPTHRPSYSLMMGTIKDLKAVLGLTLNEL